jgi:hypothetical protein
MHHDDNEFGLPGEHRTDWHKVSNIVMDVVFIAFFVGALTLLWKKVFP